MRKKTMSLVLTMVMVISSFSVIFASQLQNEVDDRTMQGFTLEEMAAIDAGTTLEELSEMGLTLEELLERDAEIDAILGENFSVNDRMAWRQFNAIAEGLMEGARGGDAIHPDFYGGSAFDYDGRIVIFIVASRLDEAREHDAIGVLLEEGLRYRIVDYSYTELRATQRAIDAIIGERFNASRSARCIYSHNVSSISAQVLINRVVVTLVEYNENMIAGFRRYVYDSPALIFRQGDHILLGGGNVNMPFCYYYDQYFNNDDWSHIHYHEEITASMTDFVNVGTGLRRRLVTGWGYDGTIGFRVRCTRNGIQGFLTTAGDAFSPGNSIDRGSWIGGPNVGTVRESIFRHVPSGQTWSPALTGMNASFVEVLPWVEITNRLPNGRFLDPNLPNATPAVGRRVYAFGGTSGRLIGGNITDVHFTLTNAGRSLHNMVYVTGGTAMSETGNSGGPAFELAGNPVGLISGGDASRFVVVPMGRVINDFRSRGFHLERY